MTDNLGRRLDALTRQVTDGSPDVGEVIAGGRRLRRRRLVASAAGVVALLSVLGVAAANVDFGPRPPAPVRPTTHEDGVFVPAQRGEPTYVLTNLKISHPLLDKDCLRRGGTRETCTFEDHVRVRFRYHWATRQFPGVAQCRIRLFTDERPVGRIIWELTSLEAQASHSLSKPIEFRGRTVPQRAEAACERGTYEGGPGYRFTYTGSETYDPGMDLPERIRLFFEVEVLTQHDPSTRTCTLRVRFESGKVKEGSFTMTGIREGPTHFDTGYPASDPVEDADLTCKPYHPKSRESSGASKESYVTVVIDQRDGCLAEPSTPRKYRVEAKFPKGSQPTRSCP